jgi:endogenous inhibitor of DNA gyrase (YacG/DUF329 family)
MMSADDNSKTDPASKTDSAPGGPAAEPGVTHFPAAGRAKACPICGKPVKLETRPFCSKRCADIDLGRWLGETYRIPAEEPPEGHEQEGTAAPETEPRRR